MKNIIKIIAIFSLSLFFVTQTDGQRDVYWLHGLNGQADRWQNYADSFAVERQMESFRPGYTSTGSVNSITSIIADSINPDPDNIGIGASLGGIVLRNLEVLDGDPSDIGGIITTHCPNQGAAIATAVNNGSAEEHLIHSVNTLAEALREIEEHLTSGYGTWDLILGSLNVFLDLEYINEIINLGIEWIANMSEIPSEEEVTSQITTAFAIITNQGSQNIYHDIDPSNGFIPNLNNYPSILPRIEVHGYETDKEPFRMGCSQDSRVWTFPLADVDPIPDDTCQVFQDLKDAESKLQEAQDALNIKGGVNILNPIGWLRKKRRSSALFGAAQDVRDAKNTIKYGLEEGWEELIFGSVPIPETREELTQACKSQLDQLYEQEQALNSSGQYEDDNAAELAAIQFQIDQLLTDPNCYEEVPVTIYVNDPNALYDGLFLDAEQVTGSALAEYWNEPILVDGKLEGVNHVEALNHPSMFDNFKKIFDRPEPDFFRTEPR